MAFQAAARTIDAHGCVYCLGTQVTAQLILLGGHLQPGGVKPFVNPPIVGWLLQPVAGLDLSTFTLLSVAFEAVALVIAVVIARRCLPVTGNFGTSSALTPIVLIAPLPGLETLLFGQWDGLMLVALVVGYLFLRVDNKVAAGAALSVLLIKPQDVWLVPILLAVAGAWPAVRGFLYGATIWVAASVTVVSIGTLSHITDAVAQTSSQVPYTVGLPGLVVTITGLGPSFVVAGVGILAAVAAWPLRDRLRRDPMLAVDLGIALSLLFSPHVFSADLLLLGAVLVDIGRREVAMAFAGVLLLDGAYLLEDPLFHTRGHVQALAVIGVTALVVAVALRHRPRTEPSISRVPLRPAG